VTSMALSQTGVLAVFTRSLALRYYTVPDYAPSPSSSDFISLTPSPSSSTLAAPPTLSLIRHTPRSHPAPVLVSTIDPTSTLLASGSADGIVKVWDLAGGYVTHLFRSHGGPVSSLAFNIPRSGPAKGQRMELITGSGDTKVRVFDLKDSNAGGKPRAVLDGHVSVVRGLGVGEEGRWLVSGGRDKVVLVWDLWGGDENGWERLGTTGAPGGKKAKGKGKAVDVQLVKTITALESLESVGVLNQNEVLGGEESEDGGAAAKGDRLVCWTAGEKGVVRIWDARRGTELVSLKGAEGVDVADASVDDDEREEQRGIVEVMYVSPPFCQSREAFAERPPPFFFSRFALQLQPLDILPHLGPL
jgi:U3 small nucleolar RNA-associated protein 13